MGNYWRTLPGICPRPRLRGLQRFRREIELFRHAREIEHRGGFHLAHDLASVRFHRNLTDTDVAGNLLVEPPLQDPGHHFALTGSQRLETFPQRAQSPFSLASRAIAFEAEVDRVQQVLVPDRLGQELDRPSLHGLNRHGNVAIRGNENDRHINVRRRELSLEIETALPGQSDVENEASRPLRASGFQELRYRRQRSDLETDRLQQAAQRISDIRIVVDDHDTGFWLSHRSVVPSQQAQLPTLSP